MLLLLHKPFKAVGTFRASPWYEQSCFIILTKSYSKIFGLIQKLFNLQFRMNLIVLFWNFNSLLLSTPTFDFLVFWRYFFNDRNLRFFYLGFCSLIYVRTPGVALGFCLFFLDPGYRFSRLSARDFKNS